MFSQIKSIIVIGKFYDIVFHTKLMVLFIKLSRTKSLHGVPLTYSLFTIHSIRNGPLSTEGRSSPFQGSGVRKFL